MIKSIFFTGLVIFVFIFTGCQIPPMSPQDSAAKAPLTAEEEAAKQKDIGVAVEVVDENGVLEDSEGIAESEMKEDPAGTFASAQYVDYSSSKYAEFKGSKPFVLFFHADWCPICQKMEQEIFADLENYPEETTFLKTDYDTETDLRREYGIRVQSTVVVIDAKGDVVYQATDPALDDLKAAIARSMEL